MDSSVSGSARSSAFDTELEERLVRYVRVDTQSDEASTATDQLAESFEVRASVHIQYLLPLADRANVGIDVVRSG